MPLPTPTPGLVVRYDYLWSREAAAGRTHGKDPPACIVVATSDPIESRFVVLLPITHASPRAPDVAVEIPAAVRRALGLDEDQAWIVVSEHNVDEWPTPGLVPIPGAPDRYHYGYILPALFAQVKTRFIALADAASSLRVVRDP